MASGDIRGGKMPPKKPKLNPVKTINQRGQAPKQAVRAKRGK